jgi:hypothetical protein
VEGVPSSALESTKGVGDGKRNTLDWYAATLFHPGKHQPHCIFPLTYKSEKQARKLPRPRKIFFRRTLIRLLKIPMEAEALSVAAENSLPERNSKSSIRYAPMQ